MEELRPVGGSHETHESVTYRRFIWKRLHLGFPHAGDASDQFQWMCATWVQPLMPIVCMSQMFFIYMFFMLYVYVYMFVFICSNEFSFFVWLLLSCIISMAFSPIWSASKRVLNVVIPHNQTHFVHCVLSMSAEPQAPVWFLSLEPSNLGESGEHWRNLAVFVYYCKQQV